MAGVRREGEESLRGVRGFRDGLDPRVELVGEGAGDASRDRMWYDGRMTRGLPALRPEAVMRALERAGLTKEELPDLP